MDHLKVGIFFFSVNMIPAYELVLFKGKKPRFSRNVGSGLCVGRGALGGYVPGCWQRIHFELEWVDENQQFLFSNYDGRGYTKINGESIKSGDQRWLNDGDIIEIIPHEIDLDKPYCWHLWFRFRSKRNRDWYRRQFEAFREKRELIYPLKSPWRKRDLNSGNSCQSRNRFCIPCECKTRHNLTRHRLRNTVGFW